MSLVALPVGDQLREWRRRQCMSAFIDEGARLAA